MQGSLRALEIERFGGKSDLEDPLDVPVGLSPDCSDVDFVPGMVFSRAGSTLLAALGSPVKSVKEFVLLDSAERRLLILTGDGVLRKEAGDIASWGTVSTVESYMGSGIRMKSDTLFGKEWMAFSADGKIGTEAPRSYDDINLDRLSSVGPGGTGSMSIISNGIAGRVDKGVHKVRVIFVRRGGAFSPMSPEYVFTAIGSEGISISGTVPIGPPDVVGRILAFTRAGDERFFYIPGTAMEIKENTNATGPWTLDFDDEELGAGISLDYLFQAIELPPPAGIKAYNNRLAAWGVRNAEVRHGDTGFLNLSFDGGWNATLPHGWSQVQPGGEKSNPAGAVGDCFRIVGDGASQRGALQNLILAVGLLKPGIAYRARARIKKSANLAAGTFHVYLVNTGLGTTVSGTTWSASQVSSTAWTVLDGELVSAANNSPLANWMMRISGGGGAGGGTPLSPAGAYFDIDYIEIYEAAHPTLPSIIYWSDFEDPENFDQLTGIQSFAENNGQAIRSCFVLRDKFYVAKEHSLYVTADNGLEPVEWQIEEVSSAVGTPSIDGTDTADGWALIASRSGLHFFSGGRPIPISDRIRGTWERINWLYGHKIQVRIDAENKRFFIVVPLDSATELSHSIVGRYVTEFPTPTADYALWTLKGNTLTFSERRDGTRILVFGQETSGNVVKLDKTTHNDNGAAINAWYRTAFLGNPSGRLLFGALTANVAGSGAMAITAYLPDNATQLVIPSTLLYDPAPNDKEWPVIRVKAERASFRFGTNAVDAYFKMRKFVPYAMSAPHAPLRGLRD